MFFSLKKKKNKKKRGVENDRSKGIVKRKRSSKSRENSKVKGGRIECTKGQQFT